MLKWLFAVPPVVGSKWMARTSNPFKDTIYVVTAVKGGWLQYESLRNTGFRWTDPIRAFRIDMREIKET